MPLGKAAKLRGIWRTLTLELFSFSPLPWAPTCPPTGGKQAIPPETDQALAKEGGGKTKAKQQPPWKGQADRPTVQVDPCLMRTSILRSGKGSQPAEAQGSGFLSRRQGGLWRGRGTAEARRVLKAATRQTGICATSFFLGVT